MATMILAGSKAVYKGPGTNEEWEFREGIECIVTKDTPFDALYIPVVFDCETEEVSTLLSKLRFTDRKNSKY